jgi:hypothetical protein
MLSIPFLSKPKQWADSGVIDSQEQQVNPFTRQAKLPFDKKHPRIDKPVRLNSNQLDDIATRITVVSYGQNELELALSRTPADTDHAQVAGLVSAIIYDWQNEHPNDGDAVAQRKLLEGSSALSDIDSKLEAARHAQAEAEAEHREFEKAYHEHRSIPAKHEQLIVKVSNLQAERLRLTSTDFDAKIKQILTLEYNPKPGMIIHESIPSLLLQRDTMALRLEVIDSLVAQCRTELERLTDDNSRLAQQLGITPHKL